jgi:muramoyltetrapeptide carboxypeptidase
MITPAYLKKGDKVAIVSPARSITFEEVHPAIRCFQRYDLEVVLGSYVFSRQHQFAGTDEQRRHDFQQMLDDDKIRAIICSRGGYGTVRIIDKLDFTGFCRNPKWIAGFSDVTVLHAHILRQFGIETLHAAMPVNIRGDQESNTLHTLVNALFGKRIAYAYPKTVLSREGRAEAILTGGNLSILYSLMGSVSEPDTAGKILFIEDVDEYLYHIDRMMMNLKRAGKLDKLKGLIVGGMSRMNDNTIPYGKTACEIIADSVKEYDFPVCFDFPAGHQDTNLALVMGRKINFSVSKKEVEVSFY